jgi:hypothetical protein
MLSVKGGTTGIDNSVGVPEGDVKAMLLIDINIRQNK